jgi:hypothetical protein
MGSFYRLRRNYKYDVHYHSKASIFSNAGVLRIAGRSLHSDAPQQLTPVREDSHRLSFINTHKGLLRYPMFDKAAGQFL